MVPAFFVVTTTAATTTTTIAAKSQQTTNDKSFDNGYSQCLLSTGFNGGLKPISIGRGFDSNIFFPNNKQNEKRQSIDNGCVLTSFNGDLTPMSRGFESNILF